MGNQRLSPELMQEAVNLVAKHGSVTAAAAAIGMPRNTMDSRVQAARRLGLVPTVETVQTVDPNLTTIIENLRAENDRLKGELAKAVRPKFTLRSDTSSYSSKIRVVCIGDAHDSPDIPDKSRFEWIGKYINAVKPDVVVQIGDFATMDSLNTHIPNENYDGKAKPSFERDMASFNEALAAMQLDDGIERHCTLGNHERRLFLYEQAQPEVYGIMQAKLQEVFERHKWTYSPYGQITYYGGVGFEHCPINTLGKSYGGKNFLPTAANDLIHDLVVGHGHRERYHRAPKIGGNNFVGLWEIGCALPDQHIESYAKHALTGWSYGIGDAIIQHGHLQARSFVSMAELAERYGRV